MTMITHDHFGGNIILTKDPVGAGSSFRAMTEEIHFSNFRYPGGGVTEDQTWENGGLERMFGEPMDKSDENYVLTIREALEFCQETDSGLTIVIPTFQFLDEGSGRFNRGGFDAYLRELEKALSEYPDVKINDFEIGNEYWAGISASDYGKIANEEIPKLDAMADRLTARLDGWEKPGIGIQVGAGWRGERDENGNWHPTGSRESEEIAAEIDIEHRGMVTTLYQHAYPDASRDLEYQRDWRMDPVDEMQGIDGFPDDMKVSLSEYNVSKLSATGTHQGAIWIEEFSAHAERGVDEILNWGLNYDWQSNKFYDSKFPKSESDGGDILTKATPMGQVYDLASTHLPGKSTLTDEEASEGIDVPEDFIVTGFRDEGQKVIFFYNDGSASRTVDLNDLPEGWHVTVNHLIDADSPYSTWVDESIPEPLPKTEIADARGDMNVTSGKASPDEITLDPGEMAVLVVSEPGRNLLIEGAHNETDDRNDMVDDLIYGGKGDDILRGHVGDDFIAGGEGEDVISAGKGDDTVEGGAGNDVIFSGRGTNEVDGGEGEDLFVVSGGREADSSTITTGDGNDLILTSVDQNLTVTDFEDGDMLGFDGAFADAAAFQEATRVDGEDLIIDLPGGGMVRVVGQAENMDSLHNQVLDFIPDSKSTSAIPDAPSGGLGGDLPLGESMLDGLNYEQLHEVYETFGTIDGLSDESDEGDEYWLGLDGTIDRTGASPFEPDPYVDGTDIPSIPPIDDDDDHHYPEDPEDEQDHDSAAGGACFVATAAFGDRMHPDVVALRRFRDEHLVKFRLGRGFVRLYWKVGPFLARHTKPKDPHGRMARAVLTSLVSALQRLNLA